MTSFDKRCKGTEPLSIERPENPSAFQAVRKSLRAQ